MNLPNKLTIMRMILIPFILLLMLPLPWQVATAWNQWIHSAGAFFALFLFLLASYTDYLDGHLARKYQIVSNMGKLLDPIADKMLVLSVLIAFVALDRVPAVVPILILLREFVVTGIRMLALERGEVKSAAWLGKIKTVTQIVAISLLLLEQGIRPHINGQPSYSFLHFLSNLALWISVFMALWSGYAYLKDGRDLLKDA